MAKLRAMFAMGAFAAGTALVAALPAAVPTAGTISPGQCVNGGGYVLYNVSPIGYSDGHGTCRGGQYDGKQIFDPSGRPAII